MASTLLNIKPIKCYECGNILGNKYECFKTELISRSLSVSKTSDESHKILNNLENNIIYFTNTNQSISLIGEILNDMNILKQCCRTHMITQT